MPRHLIVPLLAALLLAAPLRAQEGGGPPPAMVRVGEVKRQTVRQMRDVVGRLREVRRAVVAAEQAGRIVDVNAEEGDAVVKDKTVLARIDDVWARLALQAAEARVAQSKANIDDQQAQLEQAQRDLEALQELLKANSAKPKEVNDASTRVNQRAAQLQRARAEWQAAEAEVNRARENLNRLQVVAPFDGVVVRKMTEVGQWATAGSAVAEIISRGNIDAVINVPEQFVNQLQRGNTVEIDIEAINRSIDGKVEAIIPDSASAARTFPVKVRLADEDGVLKPGMSVVAHVPTGDETEALTVPRDAVQRSAAGDTVWINANGKAMPVKVRVRFGAGDRYVVEPSGGGPPLKPGTQVVVEGAEYLFPTRPLIPKQEGTQ